ncbi:sensor histidine kinase [Chitinimonas sp. BJB300]|uniref:sensor histidine kinase n=1 Tax=Chitinimonas sp. BJB300 TaxID=1559339 RepID=UPI000C0F4BC4|nr:HAMP domain-containing sensor histidine kinase [Chitinimonas sp. BJB300]PHV12970.1 ATP-binding protein [Chitinimonas sp. BJB300]TSJ89077.1 HAMP domain-containing histidine kinase [Chitinimonas sp. BJB300]
MRAALAWLASFRLRILFRSAFLLLGLAILTMAVYVLQEEKQRNYDNYQSGFVKTKEQISAKLRHPTGQLALLNPPGRAFQTTPLHPVLLPFSAIDFDDQTKVRNAVEMAGCLVQYKHYGSLCVAIGNNPWAGGFIYAAGTFASTTLVPHRIGDELLDSAHRLRVVVTLRGQTYRWIAPFEPLTSAGNPQREGTRGRLTGYVDIGSRNYKGARPVKEFRGWVWQGSQCLMAEQAGGGDCERQSFFSLRLPVEVLRDALFQREKPVWPPPDLDLIQVRVEALAPGDGAALFDSNADGAIAPFSLNDLRPLLLPGETLRIRKTTAASDTDLVRLAGSEGTEGEVSSPLLTRLIRYLPVERYEAPIELEDEIATPLGNFTVYFKGDARSVNKRLSAVATRLSWFVGAMLLAIGLAWLIIEIGIIRRIAQLTRRSNQLSRTAKTTNGLADFELADLRGSDELGILANCLNDLLRRVKEDAEREQIRAEQEKDMWHAVGHEIMSPLQSLMVLHGKADDPSHRYINRMQQAVRILYGSASPSEAFQSSTLAIQTVDINAFLRNVANNAACVDIAEVFFTDGPDSILVRADEYSLEDVVTHVLRNADRYRPPGTPITLTLTTSETTASVAIHNIGKPIPPDLIGKIFEYGISDQAEAAANGNRGQGLFVAKTYMAKMGGTITVHNVDDGVSFVLGLQRVMGS